MGDPSLGGAVEVLEGPGEEGFAVGRGLSGDKGQVSEEVEGGGAHTATDFYAKG